MSPIKISSGKWQKKILNDQGWIKHNNDNGNDNGNANGNANGNDNGNNNGNDNGETSVTAMERQV